VELPQTRPAEAPLRGVNHRTSLFRLAVGLGLTPCGVGAAALLLPSVHVSAGVGNAVAFAGATLLPIVALAIAATAELQLAATLSLAGIAGALLIALAFVRHAPITAMLLVDGALVSLAWAVGTSIGRRVQHASHLLPACVVAASADLVSLLSPEGPSRAIAESDRALSVLATWFPVPGSHAIAPALGVGDLLFMALVFGAALVHRLPYARAVVLCVLGTAAAGFASAWFGVAVPALVPISATILLGLPQVRRVWAADRTATTWSMLIAGTVVFGVAVRSFFLR
jgi:hypothetical protein